MKYSPNLLPPDIVRLRNDIAVADSLHVPTHPAPAVAVQIGQLVTREDLHTKSLVIAEQAIEGRCDERLAITDKAQPHAVHDFMAISSGSDVIPNIYDHTPASVRRTFDFMHSFADIAHAKGLLPVVSWSYDPDTMDRASGQGEKRFHAHFIGRTEAEIRKVHAMAVPLGKLHPWRQRRIADEYAAVASYVLHDVVQQQEPAGVRLVEPGATPQSLMSLQFAIDGGWDGFVGNQDVLARTSSNFDKVYHQLFAGFVRHTTTGTYGLWERPTMRPDAVERSRELSEELGLSEITTRMVGHFIANLRPTALTSVALQWYKEDPNGGFTTTAYPLGGVSYTTCITEVDGGVYGHLRPNLFTDLGGAGVSLVDGVMTKVKKTSSPMTPDELRSRHALQQEFVAQVMETEV